MAQVIGTPGQTSRQVDLVRLGRYGSGHWSELMSIAMAAAALSWAAGGARHLETAIAAFGLASAGVVWLAVLATPVGRWGLGLVRERATVVVAGIEVVVATGLGAVVGLVIAQRGDVIAHLVVIPGSLLVLGLAVRLHLERARAHAAQVHAGAAGEWEVARALERLPDDYVVLHDVVLATAHGRCEADHIVLGPTGVFVLETKRWGGVLTPGPEKWTQADCHGVRSHPSPEAQVERARVAVAAGLGLPVQVVTPVVVLAAGRLATPPRMAVARPEELRRVILEAESRWPLSVPPQTAAARLA